MERVNNMTPMPKQEEGNRKPVAKMCSCNRDKIFYQCKEKSCVNHLAQPTYCSKCLNEGKHAHFPQYEILEFFQKSDEKWSQLQERYEAIIKNAQTSYDKVEVLVRYFEAEAIRTLAA